MKALLFDVFGTVVDWRSGVSGELGAFLDRHGIEGLDPLVLADAWRAGYQPAMENVRSGRRPFVPLDLLHREMLEAVLRNNGLDPDAFAEPDLYDLSRAWHRLDPWPDAVEGLTRLKAGHIVAPLSNGNVSLLLNMARHAGLPWDAILGAEVVQAYKPTPQSYLRTVALLDLAPEEACLVAAHNTDLAAARACGLRTAFVLRPTEHGPAQTTDLAPTDDWDFVADDLIALSQILASVPETL